MAMKADPYLDNIRGSDDAGRFFAQRAQSQAEGAKPRISTKQSQVKEAPYKNYLLKQKMDALGWLARTGEFVADNLG